MANERMDKLEQSLQSLQNQIERLTHLIPSIIPKGKEEAHEEAYIGNVHSEGESSHSLHLWGPQQQSRPRPPKLDMHKFDGSHPVAWIAQMEQYFNLNNILDNETQLMVGSMYLDNESSSEEDPPLEEPEAVDEDNQKDNVPDEPVISLHVLAGISSPQTLKIRGFIKHRPVVVLIASGSTHNFIHQKVAEAVHCFVRAISNFQVQIADGGTMKCEGRCENVKLQMGDYQLKTHMFSIHMGGCDIVLGAEWLCTLGPITMDFKELYMSFEQNNSTHTLRGLQVGAPSIISSHRMEKLLKKGHHGVIAQFNAIQAVEPKSLQIHPEMQQILNNHLSVFDKPHELPPSRGEHDHSITLVPGAQPPDVCPYRYPFTQKNEIEKIIKELLEAGVIRPSISPYSSPVVMVLKKDGEWWMCPHFRALNKLRVKDKFPILVVDDLHR
eukprot:PITA_25087